jgi:hypothetical protein
MDGSGVWRGKAADVCVSGVGGGNVSGVVVREGEIGGREDEGLIKWVGVGNGKMVRKVCNF